MFSQWSQRQREEKGKRRELGAPSDKEGLDWRWMLGGAESSSVLCGESGSPGSLNLSICLLRLQLTWQQEGLRMEVIFHLPFYSQTKGKRRWRIYSELTSSQVTWDLGRAL